MGKLASPNSVGKPPHESPLWVTLQAEAQRRGTTPRALKALSTQLGLTVRKVGKFNWIKPSELDEALDRQATPKTKKLNTNAQQEILASVLTAMKGGR